MGELVFTVGFAVVVSGLGWSIVDRLDAHNRLATGEQIGLSFIIGCLVVNFSIAAIGPWQLDTVSMAILAIALAAFSVPGLRSTPWRDFEKTLRPSQVSWRNNWWSNLLWIVAASIGLSAVIQGLAPPNDYDSLMYHLALPRFDVELGYMDVPWDRNMLQLLMPALGGNLTRLVLVLSGDGAAQAIHGIFGLVAALGTAMLVRFYDYGKTTALLAAIMFLSVRAVVWEMGTVETDVLLAATAIFSLLLYLRWRETPDTGLGILFGLITGASILIKLHGFVLALAIAPLIIVDMFRNRQNVLRALIGPLVALAVITPHLVRSYFLTGNPLFPMFNLIFNPGTRDFMAGFSSIFGTGDGVLDLLISPWVISILPMHYFDGMVLGAPYLLALCPLVLLAPNTRHWLPVLSVLVVYYIVWFYSLSQQVRFLVHVAPILSAFAAVGAVHLWERTRSVILLKWSFLAIVGVLAINQAMFVAIYSALRLPPAVGLMGAADFHEFTPTMTGAHFKACAYISENLKSDERYYSNTSNFVSYYCPQAAVVRNHFPDEAKWWLESETAPVMGHAEFVQRIEKMDFRFFMTSTWHESRRNDTAHAVVSAIGPSVSRFGAYLYPAFQQLTPLFEGPFTAIYDGHEVTQELRRQLDESL